MPRINKIILTIFTGLSVFLVANSLANISDENVIKVAHFSAMGLDGWKNKSFQGETQYMLESEEQKTFLQAKSMQSASALYKKIKVDVHETPYLNWSWRVDQALPPLEEMKKSGDDYAARIYVVFKTGLTPLSAKALNYVWSSNDPSEISWPNAFTEKAIMIPLRSNQDNTNTWHQEKVNIKENLLQHFKKLPKYINGVAIMTDTDNSKGVASASYGDIYFSKD